MGVKNILNSKMASITWLVKHNKNKKEISLHDKAERSTCHYFSNCWNSMIRFHMTSHNTDKQVVQSFVEWQIRSFQTWNAANPFAEFDAVKDFKTMFIIIGRKITNILIWKYTFSFLNTSDVWVYFYTMHMRKKQVEYF